MFRESRIVMDTFCTITVVDSSKDRAKEAIDAGFARIKELETLLDFFSPESEITAVNNAAGRSSVRVSPETLDIIRKAVEVSEHTSGAFDPTIGPVMGLWSFSSQDFKAVVPEEGRVRDILELVDYRKIKINVSSSEVFLEEEGMQIDLGGIAKGYAADLVIEMLRSAGIRSALVSIAGDIRGYGIKPDLKSWRVGLQSPRPEDDKSGSEENILTSFYLDNKAVSTSGDYQRFFIKDNKRYHHILDPETGYPAQGVMSVSVMALSAYMADGYSTGVFILGVEQGIELLESLGLSGIIVDSDKKIFTTKDLIGKIKIEEPI